MITPAGIVRQFLLVEPSPQLVRIGEAGVVAGDDVSQPAPEQRAVGVKGFPGPGRGVVRPFAALLARGGQVVLELGGRLADVVQPARGLRQRRPAHALAEHGRKAAALREMARARLPVGAGGVRRRVGEHQQARSRGRLSRINGRLVAVT